MWSRCGVGGGYMMGHDSVAVWIGGIAPTVEAWDRVWKSSTIVTTAAVQKWFWRMKTMRILTTKHDHQICILPAIAILYGLMGTYSVRISAAWFFWEVSIGIVKNPHYEEDLIWRRIWEREYRHEN